MPLTPDDLEPLVASDEFKALSPEDRGIVLNGALREAHQYVTRHGGWTPEKFTDFGKVAGGLRETALDKSAGEHVAAAAKTVGGVIKDSAATLLTTAVSGFVPEKASDFLGYGLPRPGSQVVEAFKTNMQKLGKSVQSAFSTGDDILDNELTVLKQDIDAGRVPADAQGWGDWLDQRNDRLKQAQAQAYTRLEGDTPENRAFAESNSLLGNARHGALLLDYLQTRDPAVWDELSKNVRTTPGRAKLEDRQQRIAKDSNLAKLMNAAFGEGAGNYIIEAGDPLEVAGTLLPLFKGAKVVKAIKSGSKLKAAGEAVIGAAGETASELGSQFMDDPGASWEQRKQVARDAFIGALGLGGLGAGAQMVSDRFKPAQPQPSTNEPAAVVDESLPEHVGELTAAELPDFNASVTKDSESAPADQTAPEAIGAGLSPAAGAPVEASEPEAPVDGPASQIDGLQTQEVPLDTLSLSRDVPQFKSDANENGVVEPLAGKYERLGAGPVLIWERNDGRREVISGRHRFDLAKRTGEKTIPGQVVREADGFTLQHALTADAELNIRDGHGKTKDFANYFRHAGIENTEAESRGLLARAAQRQGWAIGTQASPAVFDLHQNGKLTDAQAAALASTAPGNEALQRAGIAAMNRGTPIDVTVNLLKALALEAGNAPTPAQLDLFGADDSLMLRMEEQARKATEIQRALKDQIAAVQGAAKRPEEAKQLGVNVKDPQGVLNRVNELKGELYRWESWPLHEDLRAQVRGDAGAAPAASRVQASMAEPATTDLIFEPVPPQSQDHDLRSDIDAYNASLREDARGRGLPVPRVEARQLQLGNDPGGGGQILARFGDALRALFGKRVVFVEAVQGTAPDGGTIRSRSNALFLNTGRKQPVMYLAGHEFGHALESQAPDLYRQLSAAVLAEAGDWSAHAGKLSTWGYSPGQHAGEFVNDFIGGQWMDPAFWRSLEARQPGLFTRMAEAALQWLEHLLDRVRGMPRDVRGYFKDIAAARDALQRAMLAFQQSGQFPERTDLEIGDDSALVQASRVDDGAPRQRENRARFARPEKEQRMYEPQGNDVLLNEAGAWLSSATNEQAVQALESNTPPEGLRSDHMPALAEQTLQRLTNATTTGSEIEMLQAESLLDRAGIAWQDIINREAGRSLQQVGAANARLVPIAPVLAAKRVLVDRAEALMSKRFKGGTQGAAQQLLAMLQEITPDISERVERILHALMGPALKTATSIREATAALLSGKSQREAMIEEVAQALMIKARGNVLAPERKSALAELAASLKKTLGASVQGDAVKPAQKPLGELLARAFVDQVSEGVLFAEAWQSGRQRVFDMFYDMELDRVYHPARLRREAALERLQHLNAGNAQQQQQSTSERAGLRQDIDALTAEMEQAKKIADAKVDQFWKQVDALMPATPALAYAPGMAKEAIKRGFEAAGYTAELRTGMDKSGTRQLSMQDALRDRNRAMTAVLQVWDAEADAAGVDPAAWDEGRKLAWRALHETLNEWQKLADDRAAKAAQADKDKLLAKDSPQLANLLKQLAGKVAPGMRWSDIFSDMPGTQKERQLEIYRRLMLDERLQGLTPEERLALTNELDKAWQRERRNVMQNELKRAGVMTRDLAKDPSDAAKVARALPKLLRAINLGLFNSEMWRAAVAPEYGLRTLSGAEAKALRQLAEEAWKEPEGVLRNQKLAALLNGIQRKTGASRIEVLSSYWTAAVLSGLRTQFDTFMASINGMGTNLLQASTLLARGKGRAVVDAHLAWWRGLIDGTRESGRILFKGDYSYLKRFGADLQKALDGETNLSPIPLGEHLWNDGNTFQKYFLAPVMMWTGRLMAAADHINNTATTQGAMAVARALNPELYDRAGFTDAERDGARQQAVREVTGGREPDTPAERATVSVRTREILNGGLLPEERAAASEIGDMAAYQNDPTGFFGGVYGVFKSGLGWGAARLSEHAKNVEADRYSRFAAGLLAGSLYGITGTRFMRFGFNFGADLTRFVPGSYVLGKYGFYGHNISRQQQELLLAKNVFGLMLGSTIAAIFLASDDDEEAWHLEGDWSTLTPEQIKERMSAGLERMTMWKREGGKIRRVSYKQWPTMGLFSVVGGMLDEKRHRPERWASYGAAGHLTRGLLTGYLQVKNVTAMRNLVELFGGAKFGGDAIDAAVNDLVKLGINFAGGFVPAVIKDADIWNDPRNFKPDGAWEQVARNTPILRRYVNDGRPQLNLLGEEVKLQRQPWSRGYASVQSGEAHRVLGKLLARGLNLPLPSDDVEVYDRGSKVKLESLGRDVVWKYEKAVGDGYKQWLSSEGAALLAMPIKEADRAINYRARSIKRAARIQVVGR